MKKLLVIVSLLFSIVTTPAQEIEAPQRPSPSEIQSLYPPVHPQHPCALVEYSYDNLCGVEGADELQKAMRYLSSFMGDEQSRSACYEQNRFCYAAVTARDLLGLPKGAVIENFGFAGHYCDIRNWKKDFPKWQKIEQQVRKKNTGPINPAKVPDCTPEGRTWFIDYHENKYDQQMCDPLHWLDYECDQGDDSINWRLDSMRRDMVYPPCEVQVFAGLEDKFGDLEKHWFCYELSKTDRAESALDSDEPDAAPPDDCDWGWRYVLSQVEWGKGRPADPHDRCSSSQHVFFSHLNVQEGHRFLAQVEAYFRALHPHYDPAQIKKACDYLKAREKSPEP